MIAIVGFALAQFFAQPATVNLDPFQHFVPVVVEPPVPLSEESRRMIAGDVDMPIMPPVLADPCAWVVRVDRGMATLYSRKMMITRRAPNEGWHAGQFIGRCDVSTIGPVTEDLLIKTELPSFPWSAANGSR